MKIKPSERYASHPKKTKDLFELASQLMAFLEDRQVSTEMKFHVVALSINLYMQGIGLKTSTLTTGNKSLRAKLDLSTRNVKKSEMH